jgi:putative aldouronate transport system substrate-binding protein
MKKTLSILLVFIIMLSLGAFALAQETDDPVTIYYYNNSGKLGATGLAGSEEESLKEVHDIIQEATGVDVQVIVPPVGSETEKLNTMLAGQEPIDLFWGNWMTYEDAIQPVTESLKKYGQHIMAAWPEEAISNMTRADGEIMGVMRSSPVTPYPIFIREDWLAKYGLEFPKTLDELENILKVFLENDPAGNGMTIPLIADLTGLNMGLSAGFTGKGYGRFVDEDGLVKPVELLPAYKDFIARMADWYEKGYIYAESFSSNRAIYNEMIVQGNIGATAYWYSLVTLRSPYLTAQQPEAKYITGEIRTELGLTESHTYGSSSGGLVPKTSKNVDAVIKFIDWQYASAENHLIADSGILDKHWKYVDKENMIVEVITTEAYIGEYVASQGLPMETAYSFDDPLMSMHNSWLKNKHTEFSRTVSPDDSKVIYDSARLAEEVVSYSDITRMMSEEIIKFITGVRPMDEWDDFIAALNSIGMPDLIAAYTKQYNEQQ